MKTYKTWEVIKMLAENENEDSRFRLVGGSKNTFFAGIIVENISGLLIASSQDGEISIQLSRISGIMLNGEWQLIQQSVTFIEAMKALSEGKTIRHDGEFPHSFKPTNNGVEIRDELNNSITVNEILNCKWYIEEKEVD